MNNSVKYTNNPNNKAKSRIIFDKNDIDKEKDNLAKEGLYFIINIEDQIDTNYNMLIIGPQDSPYAGGYYMFDCQFPDQYPFFPMKVLSKTQGGNIRKHPNLYKNGKCCFSFLGTWNGPPWTACHNPKTVGISMRSVLTNNPLVNEPGWENVFDEKTKLYEDIVKYFNVKYAVIEVLKNLPENYSDLRSEIYSLFLKNYNIYLDQINSIKYHDMKTVKSPVYSFEINIDCKELISDLNRLKKEINIYLSANNNDLNENENENIVNLEIVNDTTDISNENISKQDTGNIKKNSKKSNISRPEINCQNLEVGHCEKGKDNRYYIVKQYENGHKRWILKKS